MGRMSSGAIVAWWFGWSVYEVPIRMHGRRYVKEGRWAVFREAGWMDMLSYVGFKNLLIGAALFLALKSVGLLQRLRAMKRLATTLPLLLASVGHR